MFTRTVNSLNFFEQLWIVQTVKVMLIMGRFPLCAIILNFKVHTNIEKKLFQLNCGNNRSLYHSSEETVSESLYKLETLKIRENHEIPNTNNKLN